jgi:hypothetical protein
MGEAAGRAGTSGVRRAASTTAGGRAAGRELYSLGNCAEGAEHQVEQFAHIPAHLMEAYGPGTNTLNKINKETVIEYRCGSKNPYSHGESP